MWKNPIVHLVRAGHISPKQNNYIYISCQGCLFVMYDKLGMSLCKCMISSLIM